MKSIYTFYKERLIEISGKNRSLYAKGISKKFSYDLVPCLRGDKSVFTEFLNFIWKGKRTSFPLLSKDSKDVLFYNLKLDEKIKKSFIDTTTLTTDEKRNENLRRERLKREEQKKSLEREVNSLKVLKREIEEFSKETGRYELFVGYPFVKGSIGKDLMVKAPLILFPVTINIENDTTASLELKSNETVQLNKVLLLAYAKQNRLKLDDLIMEFDNLTDYNLKNVSDVLKYLESFGFKFNTTADGELFNFDDVHDALSGEMEIFNSCVLGRFPLANSIYNDYSLLEKKKLTNDSIDTLLLAKNVKKKKKPMEDVYTINDLDFAQQKAVKNLADNDNIVIYGPPGTGKSQTIVNIISDALCKNQKILVVSQKKAALEVVFNRLKNLNSKCMFVTDAEKNKAYFYERCKSAHEKAIDASKTIDYLEDYNKVNEEIVKETEKLEVISSTLFTKTSFGLSLQEMYASSSRANKNSLDYELYKNMLNNEAIMKMDYETLSQAVRLIQEKNKCEIYFKYIEERKINPLIDHISSNAEFHDINETKDYILNLLKSKPVPFDTSTHENSRQLIAFYLETEIKSAKNLKPLVKMLTESKKTSLKKWLSFSKAFFPLYPFIKYRWKKEEKKIENNLVDSLNEMENHVASYDLLKKVLDRNGYAMTTDQILNGNTAYLKLLYLALSDYMEIRDMNLSLSEMSFYERDLLNFAEENSKGLKGLKEVISKILGIRIYHEAIRCEEIYKLELSKILDFENIRTRILSLKTEEQKLSTLIALSHFDEDYKQHYNQDKENKNYLYQITKTQNLIAIRTMFELYGEYLFKLFPCWLLSPESVSTIFPLEKNMFDLVIFDEASQVFIENTIPTIFRGKRIAVAGDAKQLRPTATFMKRYMGNDDDDDIDLATKAALEVESLLDLATSRYDASNLTYHYRSKFEELIQFSNYAFYDGKLQIAPNITKNIGNKPIERIKVDGLWIDRSNKKEAEAVANLLSKIIKNKKNNSSIGIISFNTEQESAIEDAIDELCQKDNVFRDAFVQEQNRKENGEDTSIFVKNLENVQGDERDIIIFSIGYAKNEYGKVVAHFGSLSIEGGENRLNVAITRAKEKIYVVTSIEPEELSVEGAKNLGPKIFKNYLKYVRAVSLLNKKEAEFILNNYKQTDTKKVILKNDIVSEIKHELESLGYIVETNLGSSNYKLSLGIYDKELDKFLLGIECDFAAFASSEDVLERDVYRNKFLESRGWKVLRVWSRDFWLDKNKVIKKIVKQVEQQKSKFIQK